MESHNPYTPPTSNLDEPPELGLANASPWNRLGAAMVDGILIMVIILPLEFLSGFIQRVSVNAQNGVIFTPETILWAFAGVLAWLALNFKFLPNGQTIGKKLLKLQVQRKDGSAVGMQRYLLRRFLPVQVVGLIPLAGGVIMLIDSLLIFRRERNTLHDDLADTKVVQLS